MGPASARLRRTTLAAAATLAALAVVLPSGASAATTRAAGTRLVQPVPRAAADSATALPTIAFDEVPLGAYVDVDYQAQGVFFTSDVHTLDDTSNPSSPVLSGVPTLHGDIDGRFVDPVSGDPTTVASFTLDVGYIDHRDSVVVDAFDGNGDVVLSVPAQSLGINTLTLTYRGMTRFSVHEVGDEPAGFGIDNLTVDPAADPTAISSVASMGDSYSSGEGLLHGRGLSYDCGTDMGNNVYFQDTNLPYLGNELGIWAAGACDTRTLSGQQPDLRQRVPMRYQNTCHRHGHAYPVQIARMLRAQQSIFVACSGAVTDNVGVIPWTARPQMPNSPVNVAGGNTQEADVLNFRRDRLSGQDPALITIGVGGNDARFKSIIEHCLVPILTCSGDADFVSSVLNRINGPVYDALSTTFSYLRDDFPASTIVAFGYPHPTDSRYACAGAPFFAQDKDFLGGTVLDTLNAAVADAADHAGISFVDIRDVTVGHEVCSGQEWVNGLSRALTESFHPNQDAHDAIAVFFKAHYTDGNGGLLIHNPPYAGSPIRPPQDGVAGAIATLTGGAETSCGANCQAPATCVQGCTIHLQGSGYDPQAQLQAVLHSSPYTLGAVSADADGNVDASLKIPDSVEPGQHVITLDGRTPDGTPQYGSLLVQVDPAPVPPAAAPVAPGAVKAKRSRAVRAVVRVSRRGRKITVRVTCPRSAASRCAVTLSLTRSLRRHHRVQRQRLVRRKLTVPVAGTRRIVLKAPRSAAQRRGLRLAVATRTRPGTLTQTLTVR